VPSFPHPTVPSVQAEWGKKYNGMRLYKLLEAISMLLPPLVYATLERNLKETFSLWPGVTISGLVNLLQVGEKKSLYLSIKQISVTPPVYPC
jgi:hypothetical protein